MGTYGFMLPESLQQWRIPAALMLTATLVAPAWQAHVSPPETAALSASAPLIDETTADTLIIYAAPADADPMLRISSRDAEGNWQESELQLRHDRPEQSAKLVEAAVAREIGN